MARAAAALCASVLLLPALASAAGPTYDFVSWLRFHVPRLRPLVRNLLPKGLRAFLRRQAFTGRLRVREREASFYEYGRCSLWIRSVSTPSDESEG